MDTSHKPEHIIPLTSDFGFKKAFADEKDTVFARKAIQILASLDKPLKKLEYIRNERIGLTTYSRKGIIDVFCKDEEQNVYISEMQDEGYAHMFERLMFYVLHVYDPMVQKGPVAFDKVKPIHCICISSKKMLKQKGYYHKISLKNQRNQTVFDKIRFYIVELSKFTKSIDECTTDLDKLLYTMKNGHKIDLQNDKGVPPFWGEDWLKKVVEKLKEANLTPEEKFSYNIEWAQAVAEKEKYERYERQRIAYELAREEANEAKEKANEAKEKAREAVEKAKGAKEEAKEAVEKVIEAEERLAKVMSVVDKEKAKKALLEQEKANIEQEKIAIEQEKTAIEQEKTAIESELQSVKSKIQTVEQETMMRTTRTALKNGMLPEQISSILNYPLDFVQRVKKQLDKDN